MVDTDYIYFLHDRTTGTVKIGTSNSPELRLKALQATAPLDLVPIRYVRVKNGYEVEHLLHMKFASLRVRGEWFRATPELLEFAKLGVLPESDEPVHIGVEITKETDGSMALSHLAEKTGVSTRTLRYYIARGVLHGPCKRGSNACYNHTHLAKVEEIKAHLARGLTLDEIVRALKETLITTKKWVEFRVADDVQVFIGGKVSPWRMHELQQAIKRFSKALAEAPEEDDQM